MKSLLNLHTVDLQGEKFDRLMVIGFAGYFPHSPKSNKNEACWFAKCSCDKTILVPAHSLISGNTTSCGCKTAEAAIRTGKNNYKYGCVENNKLYRLWSHMKERCGSSPSTLKHASSKYYAKKGIVVCAEWREDFLAFKKWAEENGYKDNLQIDRIDNDGDYAPNNCRFVTSSENNRNKSNNRIITHDGKTMCLSEWAEYLNIKTDTLYRRLESGMSLDRSLSRGPLRPQPQLHRKLLQKRKLLDGKFDY